MLIVLSMFGCATRREIVQFQTDLAYLRSQVDILRVEDAEIQRILQDLKSSLTETHDVSRRTKADLMTKIETLEDQFHILDNKLEDTGYRLSDLSQKLEWANPRRSQQDSLENSLPDSKSDAQAGIEPKELYSAAYLDLTRGHYQLAIQEFTEYLKRYPESELADNSQYWIGEAYYVQGEYQKATEEFKKVVTDFPQGDKVAAALLKMGYCFIELGDLAEGQKYLNIVIQRFPSSEEAKLARSRQSPKR